MLKPILGSMWHLVQARLLVQTLISTLKALQNWSIKFMRWILLAFSLCCGLAFVGCSPGMLDGVSEIPKSGGYGLSDSGGDERAIVYKAEDDDKWKIVIDARVDGYLMQGGALYVARRPKIRGVAPSGVLIGRISSECEIWVVNTASHTTVKAPFSKNDPVSCL